MHPSVPAAWPHAPCDPLCHLPASAVAAFLRCIYAPEDASPPNFQQLPSDDLVHVVHLAHELHAPALLKKLDSYLSDTGEHLRAGSPCRLVGVVRRASSVFTAGRLPFSPLSSLCLPSLYVTCNF